MCYTIIIGDDMKRKGFTLIELLAVILIMGMIGTISISLVLNVSNRAKEKGYEKMEEIIKSAAHSYIMDYSSELKKVKSASCNDPYEIKLQTLVSNNYLNSEDLKNLKNNKEIDINESSVSIYYGQNEIGNCVDNPDINDYDYRYSVNIKEK